MKTVLIVDRSKEWRSIVTASLDLAGLKVLVASSARQAMDHLLTEQVDLLLLEAALSGEDGGLGFLEALRSQACFSELPVLLVAAGGPLPGIQNLGRLGVERCLIKSSFSMGELICIVQQTLRSRLAPAAA